MINQFIDLGGAAVSNVLQFKKVPSAKIVTLSNNYRSTQTILNASWELIQNNNPNRLEVVENINKKLKSHSASNEEKIRIIHETRLEDEADKIAQEIKTLFKTYEYRDIAILVRANNHCRNNHCFSPPQNSLSILGPGIFSSRRK